MSEVSVVEVHLWGRYVGAIVPLRGKPGFYEFQYAPSFVASGLDLSPLKMPLDTRKRYSFPGLPQETYHGLPGLLADALPDKFGNALINEYLERQGTKAEDITTLQRLLYVGKRAMGALEFEPAMKDTHSPEVAAPLQMAHLVEDARRALRGEVMQVTQDLIEIGSSAGGARAKAVIGWNPATGEIVSGQFDLPDDFEHWLLKFDVGTDSNLSYSAGFGRIEYAHYLMAKEAGVDISPCRLLEENGRAHFMTRRFDRQGNQKRHVHSLCGLAHLDFNKPYAHGYEQYLRAVLEMKLGAKAVEQAWLRCAFNVAVVNCDDHTKNLAFLLNEAGTWTLAPAYDLGFSHNPAPGKWTRQHQMLVNGKAWNITDHDLIELADKFGVRQPKALLDRIIEVVAQWPEFASKAGVPSGEIGRIAAHHPEWVTHAAGNLCPTCRSAPCVCRPAPGG
ncbi:MAG: type II toxin-antitoxin system HipA family toxin [Betaproteobacteria bacterium]|nr:type II toxin-antitoxin system HipA family toxin [Betaproteobacteria bacterium]